MKNKVLLVVVIILLCFFTLLTFLYIKNSANPYTEVENQNAPVPTSPAILNERGEPIKGDFYWDELNGLVISGELVSFDSDIPGYLTVKVKSDQNSGEILVEYPQHGNMLVLSVPDKQIGETQNWIGTQLVDLLPKLSPGMPIIIHSDLDQDSATPLIQKFENKQEGPLIAGKVYRIIAPIE